MIKEADYEKKNNDYFADMYTVGSYHHDYICFCQWQEAI